MDETQLPEDFVAVDDDETQLTEGCVTVDNDQPCLNDSLNMEVTSPGLSDHEATIPEATPEAIPGGGTVFPVVNVQQASTK